MLVACLLVGGAIGAPARFLLAGAVSTRCGGLFPWGTVVVNVTGALVLGVVAGLARYHGLGPLPQAAVGIGFCGALTTFSTFSYETVALAERGAVGSALRNLVGSTALGLVAAAAGLALTAAL
jgi:CrcB protein